jgi:hypothetical protein
VHPEYVRSHTYSTPTSGSFYKLYVANTKDTETFEHALPTIDSTLAQWIRPEQRGAVISLHQTRSGRMAARPWWMGTRESIGRLYTATQPALGQVACFLASAPAEERKLFRDVCYLKARLCPSQARPRPTYTPFHS